MKLKQPLIDLLPSLGGNTAIQEVDVTGNALGDAGATALAALLNYNRVLRKLELDDNQISLQGYRELVAAAEHNPVIRSIPAPLKDAMVLMAKSPEETMALLHRLEQAVARNHSPSRLLVKGNSVRMGQTGDWACVCAWLGRPWLILPFS